MNNHFDLQDVAERWEKCMLVKLVLAHAIGPNIGNMVQYKPLGSIQFLELSRGPTGPHKPWVEKVQRF
jgi:hypothetical protein